MSPVRILPALLALTLGLSLISNAEARRWRLLHFHVYGFHFNGFHARDYREHSGVDQDRRASVDTALEIAGARSERGVFGGAIRQIVRGCLNQATDLRSWPFDEITRIVAPDDVQRSALEALRASAVAGAERLTADCPREDS